MKSDEGFSDMLDKTILIDCLNENVISFSHPRILKTPTVAILLGFFFVLIQRCTIRCTKDVPNFLLKHTPPKSENKLSHYFKGSVWVYLKTLFKKFCDIFYLHRRIPRVFFRSYSTLYEKCTCMYWGHLKIRWTNRIYLL